MRSRFVFVALVALAASAYARDPKPYQTGTLLRMDAVHCGT